MPIQDYKLPQKPQRKFPLGSIVITPAASEFITECGYLASFLLALHVCGVWGDLSENDRKENDFSLENGYRLLSSYILKPPEGCVWIITEYDRSVTTILMPSDY